MRDVEPGSILVVDDDPEVRQCLVDALDSPELTVSAAGSEQEAVACARRRRPDLLIVDIRLTDGSGLEVIDRVRGFAGEVPALVITGFGDVPTLTEASQRRPVELMTKPLDVSRLRQVVDRELNRRDRYERLRHRSVRLLRIARSIDRARKAALGRLDTTCADLTSAYRTLSGQLTLQHSVIGYQNAMIAARDDDAVFATLFRTFAMRSGPVFGIAMTCDEEANLNVVGRYGVPQPDELSFCQALARPMVDRMLCEPGIALVDAGEEAELFDESVRRRLPGVTILTVPLMPAVAELIGAALLYRKGEQPFSDADLVMAQMISFPTATAVRRND